MTESMPRPLAAFRRGGFESAVVEDTMAPPWDVEETTAAVEEEPFPPAEDAVVKRVGDPAAAAASLPRGTLKRRLPLLSGAWTPPDGAPGCPEMLCCCAAATVAAAAAASPSADGGRVSDFLFGKPHRVISTEQSDWSLRSLSLNHELVLPPSLPSEPSRRLRWRPRKSDRLKM